MNSYPTPPDAGNMERMSDGFLKLHPGAPVHVFTEARDEQFHSHPFGFVSHIAAGSYTEEVLIPLGKGAYRIEQFHRRAGTSHEVKATTIHRLTGLPDGFCVTRAEYGPTTQKPGFYEPRPDGIYYRPWDERDFRPYEPQ